MRRSPVPTEIIKLFCSSMAVTNWCLVLNFEDATYVHYLNIFRRDKSMTFTSSWDN
jgi:hypothetical protein